MRNLLCLALIIIICLHIFPAKSHAVSTRAIGIASLQEKPTTDYNSSDEEPADITPHTFAAGIACLVGSLFFATVAILIMLKRRKNSR